MIKAITLKLLPLTQFKRERLLKIAENFQLIYNMTAERLPSLQNIKQTQTQSTLNRWRKEYADKIIIHSKIAEEAMEYARNNYKMIVTNGDNTNPRLSKNIIRIHNQVWSFKKKDNKYYVVIPFEKINNKKTYCYSKIWLPIKSSTHYDEIINNHTKFGVGQINIDSEIFTTSIEVPTPEKLEYEPQTFIGIDMGKNNLAVAVVLDKNGFKESKFWNGNENRHIRKSFDIYRKGVAIIGRTDLLNEPDKYEHNWMKNVNHNISREIVEIAKKYPNPIIVMEDLHRFANYKWNFYQLRQMIEYKAVIDGIKTTVITPAY
jgi:IS605 OrfB family transposase